MKAVLPWLAAASVWLVPYVARGDLAVTADKAVELAFANNPELTALRAEVQAADARLSGASLLLQANPQVSGSLGSRATQTGRIIEYDAELSQELEVFGQRGARIEVAQASKAETKARLGARRAELAADVRQAFARAIAAEQLLAIARENLGLARQTANAAEKRFEVGDSSRIEVNTAHIEVGRAARDVSLSLKANASALASLRLLLFLEPAVQLRLSEDPGAAAIALAEEAMLVRRALDTRADLLAAKKAVQGSRAAGTFAARDWLPRPRIGARYEREEGEQVVLGTLGFELPVFNQNQAGKGVAAAQATQAESSLQALERRVRQEVLLAALRLVTAREVMQAFDGRVVEAVEENLKLVNAAYAAGKLDLFELLVIRRDALDAQRGHIEAREELRAAEAELARAMGVESGVP